MSLFETLTYDEYDAPFATADDLAHFILNMDNVSLLYIALRHEIAIQASKPPPGIYGYPWMPTVVGVVRGMPEARALFADKPRAYDQIRIACKILDCAAFILRGAA